ncbi:metal-dependent hydrolase [Paenibacillus illinoisensis]|uniref:metal-dependent hydrolase n=1 Tax=Paenibacillus illinoisensis TaxID=59845 RepID=UPI00301D817D
MMGRSHLIISTGLSLSAVSIFDVALSLPMMAIAVVSSLLPDIDEPNSLLLSKTLPKRFIQGIQITGLLIAALIFLLQPMEALWNNIIVGATLLVSVRPIGSLRNILIIVIGGLLFWAAPSENGIWFYVIGATLIVCALAPHRGITHSAYGLLGWTAILYFATFGYGDEIWIVGSLSYLLHLIADSITNRGIRPLPPFQFRIRLRLMSTGTFKGHLVEQGFIVITLATVIMMFFIGKITFM